MAAATTAQYATKKKNIDSLFDGYLVMHAAADIGSVIASASSAAAQANNVARRVAMVAFPFTFRFARISD